MSAFFLFDNKVTRDPAKLETYKQQVAPVVATFGGRYRVISPAPEVVEGSWQPSVLVMIEFPSAARARAWYDSEEYRALKAMRREAVDCDGVLVAGLDEGAG